MPIKSDKNKEDELYPTVSVPLSEEKLVVSLSKMGLKTIDVKRYGPMVGDKQICIDSVGNAWLVPTGLVKGKDYFSVVVDENIEEVYNYEDDLNSMLPQSQDIINTVKLALLRAGVVKKQEWTPEVRNLVLNSILALFKMQGA